ncbi:MAG TPA: FAD binding domain-containing protein, partial [Thermodesulfobacteriota bacterium]|nr:FAD binding domain-containing protein [Thermodesulfobacteriota bacterium]
MTPFDYVRAHDVKDALRLLHEHAGGAALLAGGTDLIVKIRNGRAAPELLIDLKGISGLEAIRYEPGGGLSIGALATIHSLEISSVVVEKFPALAEAAASLGSYQVRCRATLGGNVCNGSPAADMAPALLALGARARIAG